MDLVGGAVGSIIRKLGKLLQEEYRLQAGLQEQIESLKSELESAQMALLTVGQVPPEHLDPQVRLWAGKVREASYDMEDILDTFLVNVVDVAAPAKSKGGLRRRLQKKMAKLFKKTKARHTIAGAIEDMKKRLQEVADRRDRYYVPVAVPVSATKPDPRLAHMHQEAAQLIGTDKARDDLNTMLGLSSSPSSHGHEDDHVEKMKIVSVVGAGGLGKTTLARAVYDDLKPEYDCKAFVSVGRKPDLVQVLINIFFQLDKNLYLTIRKIKDLQLLIDQLRNFLQNKRYFMVIDDVWDLSSWEIIKSALDKTNTKSGVIITTRNLEVACSEEVYYLHPLSCDDSKKLFYMRLFGGEGRCPVDEMEDVADKILGKCGGVPLAIITMASMLVGKSKEDWFEVCSSPGFYRGQDNKQVDDTVWILSLSYYDLPSDLKTCLLYLSVYPEDYVIEKSSLIWRWIAEGFVEEKTGTSLFQRGEEYFHLLINRSLIEAVESKENGIIYGCRVHDMILDLIRHLSYEENFIMISNDEKGISSRRKVRRLAHQYRAMNQSDEENRMDMTQLRSFVANGCDIDNWVLHPTFKLLRVLALEGCTPSIDMGNLLRLKASVLHRYNKGWSGLEHLEYLLHLRYLSLRGTRIGGGRLPEKMGALKLLQTLDLVGTGISMLPSTVSLLTQLVCLRADRTIAPDGFLGNSTSLEELQICPPYDEAAAQQFMEDLGHQSEIRSLAVQGIFDGLDSSMQSGLVKSLSKLHKLQRLHVMGDEHWGDEGTEDWDTAVLPQRLQIFVFHDIWFRRLPSCINPEHRLNLSHLDICVANMDDAGLKALAGLPELHYLKLSTYGSRSSDDTVWVTVVVDGFFFQKLKFFRLDGWMLHLVVSEDSNHVSFAIGKGGDSGTIGSKTRKAECRRVLPSAISVMVMSNLQELEFHDFVRALYKDRKRSCDNLFWECFPSLRKVKVVMHCTNAYWEDVDKEKDELKQAAELHPRRPMLEIDLRDEGRIHYWPSSTESDDDNNFSAQEREAHKAAVMEFDENYD